jgi:hypothetical protein
LSTPLGFDFAWIRFSMGSSYGVTGLRWWARSIWAADAWEDTKALWSNSLSWTLDKVRSPSVL